MRPAEICLSLSGHFAKTFRTAHLNFTLALVN